MSSDLASVETIDHYYRRLLVADICLVPATILLVIVSLFLPERIAGDQVSTNINDGLIGFIVGVSCAFMLLGIAANIVAWVGLFRYRVWARWLYLGVHLSMRAIALPFAILDHSPTWSLISLVENFGSLIQGAIMAIVFLSPIANRFVSGNQMDKPTVD